MSYILAIVNVVAGATLFTSALAKLRAPADFRQVLRELGVTTGTTLWWLVVCVGELLTVVLLVAPVPRQLAAVAVVLLGVGFAGAGVVALRLGSAIHCACFGALGQQRLGRPQVYALPIWVVVSLAVAGWEPAGTDERLALVVSVVLLSLAVHAYALGRAVLKAREDRVAIAEMALVGDADEWTASSNIGDGGRG